MTHRSSLCVPVQERAWPGLDVSRVCGSWSPASASPASPSRTRPCSAARACSWSMEPTLPEIRERAQILEVLGVEFRLGTEHTSQPARGPRDRPGRHLPGMAPGSAAAARRRSRRDPRLERDRTGPPDAAGGDGPAWLGITGTNGKTTTVTMLESILQHAGLRAGACGGNVGLPVIEAALDPEGFEVLALELSSFQLHWTEHLDCDAAVVLNVSADHLDWHGGAEPYVAAKGRIDQGVRTACVYSVADETTRRLVEEADVVEGARAVGLTLGPPGLSELGVIDGVLVDRAFHPERRNAAAELATLEDLAHLGRRVPARTWCSTRWPPRRSPVPMGSRPMRCGTVCAPTGWAAIVPSTWRPSTASTSSTTPRRPIPLPLRLPPLGRAGGLDRRRGHQGRRPGSADRRSTGPACRGGAAGDGRRAVRGGTVTTRARRPRPAHRSGDTGDVAGRSRLMEDAVQAGPRPRQVGGCGAAGSRGRVHRPVP